MWSDEAYSQRCSLRLRGYDYTRALAYFVTTCVIQRACFLGEIADGVICLSSLGKIVAETWLALPIRFPVIDLDAFVVMPNHFHAIVILNDTPAVAASQGLVGAELTPPAAKQPETQNRNLVDLTSAKVPNTVTVPSLSRIVQVFKSLSAIACNRASGSAGSPFWQRGYYDRIIRDDYELTEIRAYIASNPARWTEDSEYPIGDW